MISKPLTTIVLLTAVSVGLTACSSIKGRKILATESGTKTIDVGGLPIVVQRPTRAVFVLTETTYAVTLVAYEADGTFSQESLPDQTEQTISEAPIFVGPAELYTIDPERPAFGTLDYTMEFEGYYPTSINSKIDDKTIGELRGMIENLAGQIIPLLTPRVEKQADAIIQRTPKDRRTSLIIMDLESGELEVRSF